MKEQDWLCDKKNLPLVSSEVQDMTKLLGGKRKLSSLTILKQHMPNLTGHNLEQRMQPLMKKFEITVSLT